MDTILVFTCSTRYQCRDRIDGITHYAKERGWHVQTIERRAIGGPVADIVNFWNPIGIIAECGGGFPEIRDRAVSRLPTVYFDEDPANHRGRGVFVSSDSVAIGSLAARELMSAGLHDFAFVGYPGALFWSEERKEAFAAPLRMHGYSVADFVHASAYGTAVRRRALSRFLRSLPKPCGVFAANDPAAEEVMDVASAEGIRVPDELAVLGVDDDEVICERTAPPLTSIRVDFESGGFLAARLLGQLIDSPRRETVYATYPPFGVIHRQSIPLPRRRANADPRVVRAQSFIRSEACSRLAVSDVVREMGCSRRLAEMGFRECTGRTILEEITSVRIERACVLLQSRSVSAEAVANQCGWSSVSAFREAFRKSCGMTVTEWRREWLRKFV